MGIKVRFRIGEKRKGIDCPNPRMTPELSMRMESFVRDKFFQLKKSIKGSGKELDFKLCDKYVLYNLYFKYFNSHFKTDFDEFIKSEIKEIVIKPKPRLYKKPIPLVKENKDQGKNKKPSLVPKKFKEKILENERRKKAYRKYLASPEWRSLRIVVLRIFDYRCANCGVWKEKGLHIHHKTYKNFMSENIEDLVPLCKYCHDTEHSKWDY